MRAQAVSDVTERTIDIDVSGVPDIDITRPWNRKTRIIRPDRVAVRLINGVLCHTEVRGGLVLTSGSASRDVGGHIGWGLDKIHEAPEWVQTIIRESLNGVTAWQE